MTCDCVCMHATQLLPAVRVGWLPKQDNHWDCGLFLLTYAEYFAAAAPTALEFRAVRSLRDTKAGVCCARLITATPPVPPHSAHNYASVLHKDDLPGAGAHDDNSPLSSPPLPSPPPSLPFFPPPIPRHSGLTPIPPLA